ncbi:MAG: tyrosine-type recombinase/integrase [Xanthobacteraceae bacterium]
MGQFCLSEYLQAQRRRREYLTPKEVERLISAARQNRYGHRDATMILIAYRRGLRVSELCALRWDQVDFEHGLLHVRRIKNGMPKQQFGGWPTDGGFARC